MSSSETGEACLFPTLRNTDSAPGIFILAGEEVTRADYWVRQIRETVRFLSGTESLDSMGCRVFVECGPQPILLGMGRYCIHDSDCHWLASLREGSSDWQQILHSVGSLAVLGVQIDWTSFDRPYGRRRVPLPTYPFQRERYWVDESAPASASTLSGGHPLLGQRLSMPMSSEIRFQTGL